MNDGVTIVVVGRWATSNKQMFRVKGNVGVHPPQVKLQVAREPTQSGEPTFETSVKHGLIVHIVSLSAPLLIPPRANELGTKAVYCRFPPQYWFFAGDCDAQ